MNDSLRAREILTRAADSVGFPGPLKERGLTEWYHEALDGLLLRGTAVWVEGLQHVADALHASLLGNEAATKQALRLAKDFTLRESAKRCACGGTKHAVLQQDHMWCVHCHLRRTANKR